MNFLIGIFSFILGWILGVFTRNILVKIINVNKTHSWRYFKWIFHFSFVFGKYNTKLNLLGYITFYWKRNCDEIRKYKQLLDEGIITQEEFDVKKKELLNL